MISMRKTVLSLAATAVLLALVSGCGSGKPSTSTEPMRAWRSFVSDLTNTLRIARMDIGGTRILTTYDRSGGNDDFNYFPANSSAPGWVILADLKGPGVVRRLWTTGVDFGHPIRIYFDGEKTPRLSGKIEDLLGRTPPFEAPLAQYLNQCWWSYVPLTYQKSLRIEFAAPPVHPYWGPRRLFYQINVEDLPSGTTVETTPTLFSDQDKAQIAAVAQAWRKAVAPPSRGGSDANVTAVSAGTTGQIFAAEGPGMLPSFSLRFVQSDAQALSMDRMLSDVLLRVYYNGTSQPGIETPLGDFFGQVGSMRHYGSLAFASTANDLRCHLPMPFHKSIRVELVNRGTQNVAIAWTGETIPGAVDGYGYLHAFWSQTGPAPGTPHLFADLQGRGHLAGIFLQVTGLENSWWILEGDERFYVDGEQTPSWHGTGLEDYFNGGWYYRGAAFAGLHGIFDRAPFQVSQYRHQLVDPFPFRKSLRMTIERGDQNVSKGYFRSVVYAYLDGPVAAPPCPADTLATRAPENPYDRQTFMLKLSELERMNDFAAALHAIDAYIERFPDAPEKGIFQLRRLEYELLLGKAFALQDYRDFLDGKHGPEAAEQSKLLVWFHEKPDRALVGLNANAKTRVFLDGKPLLEGDHPYFLFVTGVELPLGPHTLCAESTMMRGEPWVLMGLRTQTGVAGTGPGTKSTRSPSPKWNEVTGDTTLWHETLPPDTLRGTPDAPMIGGVPNAFVLLASKAYSIRAQDWGYHKGKAYFRQDLAIPLHGSPAFTPGLTGLSQ